MPWGSQVRLDAVGVAFKGEKRKGRTNEFFCGLLRILEYEIVVLGSEGPLLVFEKISENDLILALRVNKHLCVYFLNP